MMMMMMMMLLLMLLLLLLMMMMMMIKSLTGPHLSDGVGGGMAEERHPGAAPVIVIRLQPRQREAVIRRINLSEWFAQKRAQD
jgi:hypothetical protein